MVNRFPQNICGKPFSYHELEILRKIIEEHPTETRAGISRIACEIFDWFSANGNLKQMSCRVALLKLHRAGFIQLPPARSAPANKRKGITITFLSDPGIPIVKHASELGPIAINQVCTSHESRLWNQLIARYHYLGYTPLPGAQIRYLVSCNEGLLAALSFSASAWRAFPRDHWIGWNDSQRKTRLHLVVNNSRFLILPWVQSCHLASKILARCTKQLPHDWLARYGYAPCLIETFVEKNRFHGTCYRAANWICVGQTQGRGKKNFYHLHPLPIKDIGLYPLHKHFKEVLCA